jgi:hypothetical protein
MTKKSLLLFAAAMATCALAMPSLASAASWGPLNSHHELDSPDFGFTASISGLGTITTACTSSSFTVDIVSGAILTLTTGSIRNCTSTGPVVGDCNTTLAGTRFPWIATARTTADIQVHNVHIDVLFEQTVGGGCGAAVVGQKITITGTLTGGSWKGNDTHEFVFNNAEGLTSHSALGNNTPITTRGTFRDTSQTLVVN